MNDSVNVPDRPEWVETRWILKTTGCIIHTDFDDPGACIAVHPTVPLSGVVGRPGPAVFAMLRDRTPPFEMVVQEDCFSHARKLLPRDWAFTPATIHNKPDHDSASAEKSHSVHVHVSCPPDPVYLKHLPSEIRIWGTSAVAMAVRIHERKPVSVCFAGAVTESYWDTGIETLKEYRRRGYARECFLALEAFMTKRGKRPVWGAGDSNQASMAMARSLGFQPCARVGVFAARRS